MRILYVLAEPSLGGGVKVVFQHAHILGRMGHNVHIVGSGARPAWASGDVSYSDLSADSIPLPEQDLVIATYWSTVETAERLSVGPVIHFCQGYEGDLAHLEGLQDEIANAYSRSTPTLVVSPHLAQLMKSRFCRRAYLTPPPLDEQFKPKLRFRPAKPARILIHGVFEAESKNVATALKAVKLLKEGGIACEVWRVSTFPLSEQERNLLEPDRYFESVSPQIVASITRQVDLALCPANSREGFGLPLLEAMQCQVPVVAADTPSTRFITQGHIPLVEADDFEQYAREARRLLLQPGLWRTMRQAGVSAAQRFNAKVVARDLEKALRHARHTEI